MANWLSALVGSAGGLLGSIGDLLFGGLAGLEKGAVANWQNQEYGLGRAEREAAALQNEYAQGLQSQQYGYNQALMERQAALQEEFYQNYQSPEAMVDQYRKAGLNPALMYGQSGPSGGSGTSISGQGVSSVPVGATAGGLVGLMSALGSIKATFSEAALNSALAHKADAEAESIPVKMKLDEAQTKYYNSLPEKTRAEVDYLYAQDAYLAELGFKAVADARLSNAETEQVLANTKMALQKFDTEVDLLKSAISKNEQDIQESKSREAKNFQDIKESVSKVLLNSEMSKYYKELTGKTSIEKQNDIYVKQFILPFQSRLLAQGIAKEKAETAIREVIAEFEKANQIAGLVNSYTESVKNVAVSGAAVGATVNGIPVPHKAIGYPGT